MEEIKTVELTDDNGEKRTLEHLLTYAHEGTHYIAFSDDAGNVSIFKISEAPGQDDVYLVIENDIELEEAWAVFKDIYYDDNDDSEGV